MLCLICDDNTQSVRILHLLAVPCFDAKQGLFFAGVIIAIISMACKMMGLAGFSCSDALTSRLLSVKIAGLFRNDYAPNKVRPLLNIRILDEHGDSKRCTL